MKKLLLPSALMFTVMPLFAMQAANPTDKGKKETRSVSAEVVSTDKTAKTITFKTAGSGDLGSEKTTTAKVEGSAVYNLDTVKGGEKVTLTCQTKDSNDCETVTAIKKTSEKK